MELAPVETIFRGASQQAEYTAAARQARIILARFASGLSRYQFWLAMAVQRGLVRPPIAARRKIELPPQFPGKPLSEYLAEVRQ